MLSAEEQRELDGLELAELEAKAAPAAEPEYQPTMRDRVRAATQGLTLNLSDEIGAGVGALAAKGHQFFTGEGDQPIGEIYDEMHQQFQDEREQYQEAAPLESTAFEIAGALGTGGAGLARAGGRKLLQAAAIGGESAIAGAGAADQGDRLQGAGMGAGLGLATGGLLKGGGKLLKSMSKRRLAQELGKGDDFIPLHLAQEEGAGKLYRDYLGRTYGGGARLRKQGARVEGRINREMARAQEKSDAIGTTLKHEKAADKLAAKQAKAQIVEGGKQQIDQQALDLDAAAKHLKRLGTRQAKRAGRQEDTLAAAELRRSAAPETLPFDAGDLRNQVGDMNPLKARDKINAWWGKNGFKDVKNRDFEWDADFTTRIDEVLGADPAMAIELGDAIKKIPGMTEKMQAAALKIAGGNKALIPQAQAGATRQVLGDMTHINGDALMAMRNVFARKSNKGTDKFATGALRQVANAFDDGIRVQLRKQGGKDAVDLFDDHLGKWGTRNTFNKAVDRASKKKQGNFDADDWLAVSGSRTDAPLAGASRDAQVAQATRKLTREEAGQELTDTIAQRSSQGRKRLTQARALLTKKGAREETKSLAKSRLRRREDVRKSMAKTRLAKSKAAKERYTRLSPPERTTGLSSALTTASLGVGGGLAGAAMGGPVGAVLGTGLALGSGSKVASALASPKIQRAVAGQTKAQKALAKYLRERAPFNEALTRGSYRAAAGSQGDN